MSKRVKSFNKILDYLEEYDVEMFDIIKDVSIEYVFSIKGKTGVTFLNPKDKDVRSKMHTLINSCEENNLRQVSDMIASCVIIDSFASCSEFKNKYDDIPNSLGQRLELDLQKTTGETIVFKTGAKATLDTKFLDASSKKQLHVFTLIGELPITGEASSFKYIKKQTRRRTNDKEKEAAIEEAAAAEQKRLRDRSIRRKIAHEVEAVYIKERKATAKRTAKQPKNIARNIYLETVLSLINYILVANDKVVIEETLKGKILPLFSGTYIDFYILFEPYRNTGSFLLDDWIIRDWYANRPPFDMKKTLVTIDNMLMEGSNGSNIIDKKKEGVARLYTSRGKILDEIDKQRVTLGNMTDHMRKVPEKVIEIYTKLCTNNSIGGIENIMPEPLYTLYKSNPYRKIAEDELRYLTYLMFEELENHPIFDIAMYEKILIMIINTLDGLCNKPVLLNIPRLKSTINPIEKITEIKHLIDSSFFLYIPLSNKEITDFPHDFVAAKPDPNDDKIFHPLFAVQKRIQYMLTHSNTIVGESDDIVMRVLQQLEMSETNGNVQEVLERIVTKKQTRQSSQQ